MDLRKILDHVNVVDVRGSLDADVSDVCFDSRKVTAGCLFVAVRGTQTDGHSFIADSVRKGAAAVICEEFLSDISQPGTYIKVKDSSEALGHIASDFYGNPSSRLKLTGVTGTNGKTTVATLLYGLFESLGYKTGLLSTVINKVSGRSISPTHTTPDALQINRMLAEMTDDGCTHCFMEVSSHAIDQNRISGLFFTGGIFTNITHDHLDYHKTFDEYLYAKKRFFDSLGSASFALTNKDDRNGMVMLQNCSASKKSYSMHTMADFRCRVLESRFDGMLLNIDGKELWTKLTGTFNASNLLAVYAASQLLKTESNDALSKLSALNPVEGRFDCVMTEQGVVGIIDYAHTPDALKNVLETIGGLRTRNEALITIVGCGGDRDIKKRPVMTRIACEMSDKVILTSDNPRSETPENIIKEMQAGIPSHYHYKAISITDRREAIRTSCMMAKTGDIILIAGKGHEKYQEILGVKHPFDDKQVFLEACNLFKSRSN